MLCINRTLAHGFIAGVSGGLGTAVADAAYAAVAAFGLTAVAAFMTAIETPVQLVGLMVLAWLGWNTWRQPPTGKAAAVKNGTALAVFAQTFMLTMANPATILSFMAIFAGLGLGAGSTPLEAWALVSGTFAGSMGWWIVLSGGVSLLRTRITSTVMLWINRIAGALLMGFAAWIACGLLQKPVSP
jgi:putative LysE/RhtB family amino acid efflux pump